METYTQEGQYNLGRTENKIDQSDSCHDSCSPTQLHTLRLDCAEREHHVH